MNYEQLEQLNKQFSEETKEFYEDFVKVFRKHMKKSRRSAIVNMIHLPVNGILSIIAEDEKNVICEALPELPEVFIRFMNPFIKLKHLWGKIPNEQWAKEYGRLYSDQFEGCFPSEEEKKDFKEWFEGQNQNGDTK